MIVKSESSLCFKRKSVFSCQIYLVSRVLRKTVCLEVKELHSERKKDCSVGEEICLLMLMETRYMCTGFVLLLEVLEKPWNLILDFKGA